MASAGENRPEQARTRMVAWYVSLDHDNLEMFPIIVASTVFICLLLARSSGDDPQANLSESRAEVRKLQIPPVPDEANAANEYRTAKATYVAYNGDSAFDPTRIAVQITGERAVFAMKDVTSFLSVNQRTIQHLVSAGNKNECHWGLDQDGLNRNPNMPRGLAWPLIAEARIRAYAGDHQGAAAMLHVLYAMARHLNDPRLPDFPYDYVRHIDAADRTLQAVFCWSPPRTMSELQNYLEAAWLDRAPQEYQQAWIANRFHYELLEFDTRVTGTVLGLMEYGTRRRAFCRIAAELQELTLRGERLGDHALSLYEEECLRLSGQSWPSFRLSPIWSIANRGMVIRAAMACHAFRLMHGRYPESWSELQPKFLPSEPRDLCTNRPLRLLIDPNGLYKAEPYGMERRRCYRGLLRIYGNGPNGLDDGGKSADDYAWEDPPKPTGTQACADDIVFRLPPICLDPEDTWLLQPVTDQESR